MLRKNAEHIIIGPLSSTTVNVTNGVIRIEGYGEFTPEMVINCYNECPSPCTKAVKTVTVTIPESCECPYSWALEVVRIACNTKYDTQTTFNNRKNYEFVSTDGSTPTAQTVRDNIVAQINADPFRFATAAPVSTNQLTLTELDCDGLLGSCGIDVYVITSGTVANTTAHADPVMPAWKMAQTFPIQWGHVGSNPKLGRCADYCVYYLHIRGTNDIQDIDMSSTWSSYDREVFFYVDPDDATYDTNWVDKLSAELDCITT